MKDGLIMKPSVATWVGSRREGEKKDGKHVEKELAHDKSRKYSILPTAIFYTFYT